MGLRHCKEDGLYGIRLIAGARQQDKEVLLLLSIWVSLVYVHLQLEVEMNFFKNSNKQAPRSTLIKLSQQVGID